MIYLMEFCLPTQKQQEDFFNPNSPLFKTKNHRTIYTSYYPFHLFDFRDMPTILPEEITIFCGGNGSGKSTVLNVIAEKLGLPRTTPYNRTDFFDDYTDLCDYTLDHTISPDSRIITSDDIFDHVLDIRRLNAGIDRKRETLIQEYIDEKKNPSNPFTGLDDYDAWKRRTSIRQGTQSQFIRQNLIRNVTERSNGESSLSFFVDKIADGGLYLLDEPENSLSPANQLRLKDFIENCVSNHACQFMISTHSPFLLALEGAKIYDLDREPIGSVADWRELDSIQTYMNFFDGILAERDKRH